MMAALALAAALTAGTARGDPDAAAFDARMAASVQAAERLEGPLDGRWTLYDARRRPLYVLQISDPPQHAGPLEAAWRSPRDGTVGQLDRITHSGERLSLTWTARGRTVIVALRRAGAGPWRGRLDDAGRPLRVVLRRS
jgi:hypothetical protein